MIILMRAHCLVDVVCIIYPYCLFHFHTSGDLLECISVELLFQGYGNNSCAVRLVFWSSFSTKRYTMQQETCIKGLREKEFCGTVNCQLPRNVSTNHSHYPQGGYQHLRVESVICQQLKLNSYSWAHYNKNPPYNCSTHSFSVGWINAAAHCIAHFSLEWCVRACACVYMCVCVCVCAWVQGHSPFDSVFCFGGHGMM